MKKKLLSLVLAGAMVASTSVSAFADDTHEIQSGKEKEVEVKVEGNITGHDGSVLPSSVTVTVPTTVNFTVNANGDLSSPTMYIRNSGETAVSVIASEFVDSSGGAEIDVVKEETNLSERKNITLKITGGDRDFILTSEANGDKYGKIYKANGSDTASDEDRVIGKATKDKPLELRLTGKGFASQSGNKAIQDSFKLKLKIKQQK